jgi:hypothetical protein
VIKHSPSLLPSYSGIGDGYSFVEEKSDLPPSYSLLPPNLNRNGQIDHLKQQDLSIQQILIGRLSLKDALPILEGLEKSNQQTLLLALIAGVERSNINNLKELKAKYIEKSKELKADVEMITGLADVEEQVKVLKELSRVHQAAILNKVRLDVSVPIMEKMERDELLAILRNLYPKDVAKLLEKFSPDMAKEILKQQPGDRYLAICNNFSPEKRKEILGNITPKINKNPLEELEKRQKLEPGTSNVENEKGTKETLSRIEEIVTTRQTAIVALQNLKSNMKEMTADKDNSLNIWKKLRVNKDKFNRELENVIAKEQELCAAAEQAFNKCKENHKEKNEAIEQVAQKMVEAIGAYRPLQIKQAKLTARLGVLRKKHKTIMEKVPSNEIVRFQKELETSIVELKKQSLASADNQDKLENAIKNLEYALSELENPDQLKNVMKSVASTKIIIQNLQLTISMPSSLELLGACLGKDIQNFTANPLKFELFFKDLKKSPLLDPEMIDKCQAMIIKEAQNTNGAVKSPLVDKLKKTFGIDA